MDVGGGPHTPSPTPTGLFVTAVPRECPQGTSPMPTHPQRDVPAATTSPRVMGQRAPKGMSQWQSRGMSPKGCICPWHVLGATTSPRLSLLPACPPTVTTVTYPPNGYS